jgi:hypothetical protein
LGEIILNAMEVSEWEVQQERASLQKPKAKAKAKVQKAEEPLAETPVAPTPDAGQPRFPYSFDHPAAGTFLTEILLGDMEPPPTPAMPYSPTPPAPNRDADQFADFLE